MLRLHLLTSHDVSLFIAKTVAHVQGVGITVFCSGVWLAVLSPEIPWAYRCVRVVDRRVSISVSVGYEYVSLSLSLFSFSFSPSFSAAMRHFPSVCLYCVSVCPIPHAHG